MLRTATRIKRISTIPRILLRFNSTNVRDPVTIIPTIYELTNSKTLSAETDSSLLAYLRSRHLVESQTSEKLFELTKPDSSQQFKLYCGADPSAASLHLGNLLPLMILLHFNLRGHDVVGLVGGATGQIGDPSGRLTERSQMKSDTRETNVEKIQGQLERFLNNGIEYAKSRSFPQAKEAKVEIMNNKTWWAPIKMLDFLAEYGRFIRISSMLARDSISSRLENTEGGGLGFNEFTYQILQAYDFWHLYRQHGVNLQVGGNDQWGNITAGIDLIGRLQHHYKIKPEPVFGVTVPLLTTPTGEKFGKSAGNAVFIDERLTTPYQMYQYFIHTPDEMVEKLLKIFTLLPLSVIEQEIMPRQEQDPGVRLAQRVLAREVVDLIHGVGTGDEMAFVTGFLFPTPDQPYNNVVSAEKLIKIFRKSGILVTIKLDELDPEIRLSKLLAKITKKSNREMRQLIKSGGVYLGLERDQFEDPDDVVLFDPKHHLIEEKMMLVRVGKQNYSVVEFV
ncbi:MSY1 [[Candida] subhashii]|uniref:tyrosine--tRNA ligase n=1 Tax=[Candida] subhashii TaxID=561895 RepID=A0A8J5URL0_9ASCO|nr:MSY1 [[Candida] subhashii]KAG7665656.1 MSY1 [[Candida] subhashii]